MKKFTFSLQAVLTLRRMRQEQALRAYAESMQAVAARQQELDAAQQKSDRLIQLLNQPAGARFSAVTQSTSLAALKESEEEVQKKQTELGKAKKRQDEKLSAFLHARHEAELLERLREKQVSAHKAQGEKKEEFELEELVLARVGVEKNEMAPINQQTCING